MEKSLNTPVLFVVFNRPDVTRIVWARIKEVKPKYLYVAADGPRTDVETDLMNCIEVRSIVSNVDWDCEIQYLFCEENLGCKLAVSNAISWFFNSVNQGIILEDDCFPDLSFFSFCEVLLDYYSDKDEVMMIGGNNFSSKRHAVSYYFTIYPHIWGWATWKRAWEKYTLDIKDYEIKLFDAYYESLFQSKYERKYWLSVFKKVANGTINTWDYQWTYAIWKNKGVSITPAVNLVTNLGLKNNSTHFFLRDSVRDELSLGTLEFPLGHPPFEIDKLADKSTYINVYSRSLQRMFRLIVENSLVSLFFYLKKYFIHQK